MEGVVRSSDCFIAAFTEKYSVLKPTKQVSASKHYWQLFRAESKNQKEQ